MGNDKSVDRVTATAEVDRRFSDFRPISFLSTPVHVIEKPRFSVIDYHNPRSFNSQKRRGRSRGNSF